jgi:hypothetical protein
MIAINAEARTVVWSIIMLTLCCLLAIAFSDARCVTVFAHALGEMLSL